MSNGTLPDLFLVVSQALVDHPLETIRASREARIDEAAWEPFFPRKRSPIALTREIEVIDQLRRELQAIAPGILAGRLEARDASVPALIAFLRAAAPTVAAYLKRRNELTYPNP